MTLQLVTPPAVEPVTLSDAKAFLRVGTDHEDNLIMQLIATARQRVEAETGRALISRTYREVLDGWYVPGRATDNGRQFRLARPPLIAVSSVTIYDADDVGAVWDAANYFVDTQSDPGRVAVRTRGFPSPGRDVAGIEILFEAGYGASADDVPEALREAVLRLIADAYLNREGGGERSLPMAVQSLLAPFQTGAIMSAESAFQATVLARLEADAGVKAALGDPARIFDGAPEGAAFPYLTVGRGVSELKDAGDVDLIEHRLTLHLWTRDLARRETKDMLGGIRAALHDASFALAGGFALISCRVVYADVFRTADSRLAHGVMRLQALIQTD